MTILGRTDLDVFRICLGGNVFGWTADEPQSHAILDAYVGAGGNFIDTANSYLVEHGRSETIIGRWIAARGNRDQIVLATKVGGGHGALRNLRADTIEREAHASLEPCHPYTLAEHLRTLVSIVSRSTLRATIFACSRVKATGSI